MKRGLLPWTILTSVVLHGVAFASLASAPHVGPPRKSTPLRFDVVEAAKAAPPAPPPPPAKPEPPKPTPPRSAPLKRAPETVAPPAVAPPPASPPAESPQNAGVTLAAEGAGNAFSMPLGTGGALEPTRIVTPAPINTPAPTPPAPTAVSDGPRVVAVGDLSARPAPPSSLGAALERNYPAASRRDGLSGSAKVRARIDPDGVVRRVTLLEESAAGFGAACSRTLNGSRWAAPKDKAGHSVATEIKYTCRFVVSP